MKVGGQILWNVLPICENIQDLLYDGKSAKQRFHMRRNKFTKVLRAVEKKQKSYLYGKFIGIWKIL